MSFEYTMLKGQITCAQKDTVKKNKKTHTQKKPIILQFNLLADSSALKVVEIAESNWWTVKMFVFWKSQVWATVQ